MSALSGPSNLVILQHKKGTLNEARVASQRLHLFLHAVLMVAIRQVEANGIGEVEVDLVDETMPFPQLAQNLLFLVLSSKRRRRWQGETLSIVPRVLLTSLESQNTIRHR